LKTLIINADDYGHCDQVNAAVQEVAMSGLLGGVSILANGERVAPAIEFLRGHQEISAGVHLNVVEGMPLARTSEVRELVGADGRFVSKFQIMKRWILHPRAMFRAVEAEWRAQIETLLRDGVRLTHADSHQHLHAFPPAYRCAIKLCREYGIPAVRCPDESGTRPDRRLQAVALRTSFAVSRASTSGKDLLSNDCFRGFGRSCGYGLPELTEDLASIPEGLTELAMHPSMSDGVPYPRIRGDRERRVLLDETFPTLIKQLGIRLTTWETVANGFQPEA
jgi:predicted glycoside hydrolase/deacetylase ChbG (UPF0249 family)